MLTILGITVAGSFVFGWLSGRNSVYSLLNGMYDDEQLRDAQRELRETSERYEAEIAELHKRLNDTVGWNAGWQACELLHEKMARINREKLLELQADLATAS